MTAPVSSSYRGWYWDQENSKLDVYFGLGAAGDPLKMASVSRTESFKVGVPYETSASIIDGNGMSLATGYSASASNRLFGVHVNVDTGSTDLTGDTYCGAVRGRTVIGTTQSNASLVGTIGQVDVGASKNIQGNVFGIDGVLDFYGASTAGSGAAFYAGAGRFTLWNEGTTTVGAGGVLCGIDICQNSGQPTLGSGAINPAIHIRSQSGKSWEWGLYAASGFLTNGISLTCASLASTAGRIAVFKGTMATPAMDDGYGCVEIETTVSGTATNQHSALSSWVNITGSGAIGSKTVSAQTNGIYADSGGNTGSIVIFGMRAQGMLTDAPTVFAPFSINTSNRAITGLFQMTANPDVGYEANASTSGTKVGDVPLFCDNNGQQYFVRIYRARG